MTPQVAFLLNQSTQYINGGKYESALLILNQALRVEPNSSEVLRLLGIVQAQKRDYQKALSYLDKALKFSPRNGIIHSNRGNVLQELKCFDEALNCYDRAIALDPNYAEAYSNRGNVLQELKRFDEALSDFNRCAMIRPNYVETYINQGNTLYKLGYLEGAVAKYKTALNLKSTNLEVWLNCGICLAQLKDYQEAAFFFETALKIDPNFAGAWSNLGALFEEVGNVEGAIACYQQAMKLNPDIELVPESLLLLKAKICDWSGFSENVRLVMDAVNSDKNSSFSPFQILIFSESEKINMRAAELFSKSKYNHAAHKFEIPHEFIQKKIRVGYYSADFYNHATTHLIAEFFELHDRCAFQIVAFNFGPNTGDESQKRIIAAFDDFIDVSGITDEEVAKLSRDMEIDIAVDLKGYTKGSRPGIFSYRAAPIQINYLGYPGGMGSMSIDYIIADEIVIPEPNKNYFVEKIIYLPNSYQVNDSKRHITKDNRSKLEHGLPENGFVFCCFNNNYKITPAMLDIWARILNKVEGSVLWLLSDSEKAKENLINEGLARGIAEGRLIFAERVGHSDHLARQRYADLFIDTYPCNAHTTASDALWIGLPVLTMIGKTFAGRVAASLLHATELQDLISESPAEYENCAVELAMNQIRLREIKRKLVNARENLPLFNIQQTTRHIELAYKNIYHRNQSGLPPDHLYVKNISD